MASGTVGGAGECRRRQLRSPSDARAVVRRRCPLAGLHRPLCTGRGIADAVDAEPPVDPRWSRSLRSYPARAGHDQFYGYGRVNINRSRAPLLAARRPTRRRVADPARGRDRLAGLVPAARPRPGELRRHRRRLARARGTYTCQVLVAPGPLPEQRARRRRRRLRAGAAGRRRTATARRRTGAFDGKLAQLDVADLEAHVPAPATGLHRPRAGAADRQRQRPAEHGAVRVRRQGRRRPRQRPGTGDDRRGPARATYLHRDADMLDGFPRAIAAAARRSRHGADGRRRVLARVRRPRRRQPQRADLRPAATASCTPMRPDGHASCRAGRCAATRPASSLATPAARGYATGEVADRPRRGDARRRSRSRDADHDGVPEVYAADLEGKVYGWNAEGERIFTEETEPRLLGQAVDAVRERPRQGQQQPHPARLPRLAGARRPRRRSTAELEIVAAAMDRHVYAWNATTASDRSPTASRCWSSTRPRSLSIDPTTHAVTFSRTPASEQQGAIVDTPAVGDLDDDANDGRRRAAGDRRRHQRGVRGRRRRREGAGQRIGNAIAVLGRARPERRCSSPATPGSTRSSRTATATATRCSTTRPLRPGWPFKLGIVLTGAAAGRRRGHHRLAGDRAGRLPARAASRARRSARSRQQRPRLHAQRRRQLLLRRRSGGYQRHSPSADRTRAPRPGRPPGAAGGRPPGLRRPRRGSRHASCSRRRHPPRARPRAARVPAGGQDFIAAWDTWRPASSSPGFPAAVNDLQFLTGPLVADIDGLPGEEIIAGTASMDLAALNARGRRRLDALAEADHRLDGRHAADRLASARSTPTPTRPRSSSP